MRNTAIIALVVVALFVIEQVLIDCFGGWFRPNLLITAVVFFNLYRGIRYGMLTAFWAGLLRDCFSADLFGLHIFVFMGSACLASFVKMYFYIPGSGGWRVFIVFVVTILYVILQGAVRSFFVPIDWGQVLSSILLPELIATTVVAGFVFRKLKECALKLFA